MNPSDKNHGFTLLELSIVLIIIALVTGMAVTSGISMVESARLTATQQKMKAIETALMQYRIANDRLPCPSDLTIAPGSANYGLEAGAGAGSAIGAGTGACAGAGMLPQANFTGAGSTNTFATAAEGALPAVTLGLSPDFMVDGWGNQFRYAVDTYMTAGGSFTSVPLGAKCGPITVSDANGNARSVGAVYALVSHGVNGHGAYTRTGAVVNAGSVNANELTNCHCNSSGTGTTYAPTYVQMQQTLDPANSLDSFDDPVSYKERWQMQTGWDKTGSSCGPMLAVGSAGSPYLTLYSLRNGVLKMLPAPATMPDSGGTGLEFSPDNTLLSWTAGVTGSSDMAGLLYKVSSSGLTYLSTLAPTGQPTQTHFSPNGNYLEYGGNYPYGIMFQKSGGTYTTTGVSFTAGDYYYSAGWSADSSTFYGFEAHTGLVDVYTHSGAAFTLASQINAAAFGMGGYAMGGVAVHPSGNYIAFGSQYGTGSYYNPIVIKNPTTSPAAANGPGSGLTINWDIPVGLAWSPDGTFLAIAYYSSGLVVYGFNATTGLFTPATVSGTNCTSLGESVAWTSDGNYLAVACIGSPSLILFSRSGTTFTNMNLSNSLLPPGDGWGVAFTH